MTSPRPPRPPRADHVVDLSMRARQLASSVRNGRKVVVQPWDEFPFEGYLCGWDSDTYMIIIPARNVGDPPIKRLMFREAIQWIDLVDESTFFEEEDHDQMKKIVEGFKAAINKDYFSRD